MGAFMCDALTGTLRWQGDKSITIGSESPATVAVSGHTVYIRAKSALFAVDAATGVEQWHYANKGGASSPVATETAVILGMGNGAVVKLDAATGKELWTNATAGTLRKNGKPKLYFDPLLIATPLVSGDKVYLCTTDGQLLTLDAATGAELAVQEFGMPFTASPAVSGNAIFLAAYNGTVFALVSPAP